MVSMAQRIEALRTQRNISRPALAVALGFSKNAIEKFETGRQSPTKEQAQKLADYFGVSIFYLKGESDDPTRQDSWLSGNYVEERGHVPMETASPKKAQVVQAPVAGQGTIFDSFLKSKAFQEMVRTSVREVLQSPEGQELIAKAVKRELARR